ncbi:MAG TPA: DUF4340 domain-containing protein [Bacteroidales bacterium]|nr:DUF4340 domain-containing protein [Bacteroidales bacterium]
MNKNKILYIITIALVIFGGIILINRNYSTLDQKESGFAVEDTSTVTKIFMVDKNNLSVKLEKRDDGRWIINDKFLGHQFNMAMLLGTMKDLTVRYPVPLAARDNVLIRLASIARKVEIYQMKYRINLFDRIRLFPVEKLTRTYYVGDATQDNLGTYMLMEGADQPYVVFLPTLRGFIYTRFSTNEDDWRDHTVFKTPLQDIDWIKLEFMEDPEESFIVETDDNGSISMTTLYDQQPKVYDTLRMLQFITAFKDVRFESVLNNKLEKEFIDSVAAQPMAHIITLKEKDGDEFVVRTFRKGGFSQFYEEDGATIAPFDLDRLYAYINDDRDFVLLQYFVFDKVLRTASYLQNKE